VAGLLSGDVDIPHVGKLPKAAVAVGVGGVIVLVIIEKRRASASSAAAAVTDTGDDSVDTSAAGIDSAGDPYAWDGTYGDSADPDSIDNSTGETYGDEGYGYDETATSTTGVSGPPFSTNAQWSQYVLSYFSTNGFADLAGMTDAIGLYLNGGEVNVTQHGYINDATAIGGSPPVAGPGNYPPSIRLSGSTSTTGATPTVSGGHVVSVNNNDAAVAWTGTNATSYRVTITGPGPLNGRVSTVKVAEASFSGMEAGHNYTVTVVPVGANGKTGKSGAITVKTTKGK
jgi:hypothetical protein